MVPLTCKTCGTALPCHRWKAKPRPARAAGNPACRPASRSGRGWRSGERCPRRPRRWRSLRSDALGLFAAQTACCRNTKRRGFLTARLVGPHHLPPEVQHRLGVGQPRRADQPCSHRLLLARLEECNPGGSNDRGLRDLRGGVCLLPCHAILCCADGLGQPSAELGAQTAPVGQCGLKVFDRGGVVPVGTSSSRLF